MRETDWYTVEVWVITGDSSEFRGQVEIVAGSPREAVESADAWEWARADDYGDAERVSVRLLVRDGATIVARDRELCVG